PFLLLLVGCLAFLGCVELTRLLPAPAQPRTWLCLAGVLLVLLANWPAHILELPDAWHWIVGAFAPVVLGAFLVAMACVRKPAGAVGRMALAVWIVASLALLPSFLLQLRWLPDPASSTGPPRGLAALALGIFIPKVCDIGAYFTGRLLGRHKMTPVLSPKKTW